MQILSIIEWAKWEGVPERKAFRWAESGKLPIVTRKVETKGVPANITKADLGKS